MVAPHDPSACASRLRDGRRRRRRVRTASRHHPRRTEGGELVVLASRTLTIALLLASALDGVAQVEPPSRAAVVRLSPAPLPPGAELSFAAGASRFEEPLAPGAPRPIPSSALVRLFLRTPARMPVATERPVLIAETLDVVRPERERVYTRTLVR